MKKLLGKISIVRVAVIAGVIVFAGAAYGWWHFVYSNPKNVFNRMLATSLSSSSVTRNIKQDDDVQILTQTSQLVTSPSKRVHATNTLRQVIDAGTVVNTESIATPKADFVRYTGIRTTQKNTEGKDFDFKSVIGVWGVSDGNDPFSGNPQLFAQNIFGVMPIANLPAAQRKELIDYIHKNQVFKTNFGKVGKSIEDGRPVYTYGISVPPKQYVTLLKMFAKDLGITQLEQVDPEQYADSNALNFLFKIDVWSGQLKTIQYKDSNRTENMTAYGARLLIDTPSSAVTLQELQTKLQGVQ